MSAGGQILFLVCGTLALVTAIITEVGVAQPPSPKTIAALFEDAD